MISFDQIPCAAPQPDVLHLQIRPKKANPINVGVYEEFPALDGALE